MELRVLKYVLTVAQESSITKAAEILHITQPTLSRQLMQLENELGVSLMVRTNREILLTEGGILFEQRAKEILELSDRAEREIRHHKTSFGGTVSIGTAGVLPSSYIGRMIRAFRDHYPENEFYLYTSCADNIRERIDKGLTSVGLFAEQVESGKYSYVPLQEPWQWHLLVPKTDQIATRGSVSIKELDGLPLIVPKRVIVPLPHDDLLSFLYDHDIPISGSYNLNTNAQTLVRDGVGYALALYSKSCWLSQELKAIPIEPQQPIHAVLAWSRRRPLNPSSKLFIRTILEEFGEAGALDFEAL